MKDFIRATVIVGLGLMTGLQLFAAEIPGFRNSPWFQEQVREECFAEGVRVRILASRNFDHAKPTHIICYATPNGNTIEQTLGCGKAKGMEGMDWRFDIQHIAAQWRLYRETVSNSNVVLACLESEPLSWPAWKQLQRDGPGSIREIVQRVRSRIPVLSSQLTLACHSGGGSFVFGMIDASDEIPGDVERILFLDANYSFQDSHAEKLQRWLQADGRHQLIVLAYDDRKVQLNGKPVVGPQGGTFRATDRMHAAFARGERFTEQTDGDWWNRTARKGQILLQVHKNPENRILHTALVGEMNGFLHGLTYGGDRKTGGKLGAPRAYEDWIQPAPGIPARPRTAITGSAFFEKIAKLARNERELAIVEEVSKGNLPDFLRQFQRLTVQARDAEGVAHTLEFEVMPDYLAIGSDEDFVRVPMSPQSAATIADIFGCALPTRKLVNDITQHATVRLEPKPLTQDRESPATFLQHHRIIEEQRAGKTLGELVAGIKKDLVVSNRLEERANRVAIFGWHYLNGQPIQPLNVSHVNWYVDYSHGVRLIRRSVRVDDQSHDLHRLLGSRKWHPLVSDEGLIRRPTY